MFEKIGIPLLAFFIGLALPAFKVAEMAGVILTQSTTITTLSGEKVELTEANGRLVRSLEEQTAKVSAWEAEAERKKKAAAEALAEANRKAEEWRVKYRKLLSDPPDNPNDQAASLEARMKAYLEARATP